MPLALMEANKRGRIMLCLAWAGSVVCSLPQVKRVNFIFFPVSLIPNIFLSFNNNAKANKNLSKFLINFYDIYLIFQNDDACTENNNFIRKMKIISEKLFCLLLMFHLFFIKIILGTNLSRGKTSKLYMV